MNTYGTLKFSNEKSESSYDRNRSSYERNIFVNSMNLEVKPPTQLEHSHTYKSFCDGEYDLMNQFENGAVKLYQDSLQKLLQEYKLEIELYQEKINTKLSSKNNKFSDIMTIFVKHKNRLQVLYQILKRILLWYWQRKTKRQVFVELKIYGERRAFLRRMNTYCKNLYKRRLLRKTLKKWTVFKNEEITTKYEESYSIKLAGEMELLKQEYGQIIVNLQILLQKKVQERDEEIKASEELFARYANVQDLRKTDHFQGSGQRNLWVENCAKVHTVTKNDKARIDTSWQNYFDTYSNVMY